MIALKLVMACVPLATPANRSVDIVGPTIRWQPSVPIQSSRTVSAPSTWSFGQLLPIRTPEIRPGIAQGKLRLARPMGAPLCVLSADASSTQWLAIHAAALASAQISCWVVNVEDLIAWSRLRQVAGAVVLMPMSGAVLAELGLRATPALVQRDGRVEGLKP